MKQHTLIACVEDVPGVLNRITSLFRRRNFNIASLTVGATEQPGISRLTVVVDAGDHGAEIVEANLWKLFHVLSVDDLTRKPSLSREMALVKVTVTPATRAQVLQLTEVFRARVVDVDAGSLVIEASGTPEKIGKLELVLRPYGILEMVRTGVVAMARGADSLAPGTLPVTPVIHAEADDERLAAISMSV